MKKERLLISIILFLFWTNNLLPGQINIPKHNEKKPLIILLQEFKKKGFKITGPVKVSKISKEEIILYKHGKFSKRKAKIINQYRIKENLKPGDKVYILKKNHRIILIKLPREVLNNV